ncbi:MAG: hypothetical protein V4722_06880 [Bacteroidota bacterium]
MDLTISKWIALQHLIKYHHSIRQFPNYYLPLIYNESEKTTGHFIYLCPLCLSQHILYRGDVWSCSEEFTLDHYPPQNIGGSKTVLTCKTCNNTAGGSYEPIMEEWLTMMSFNQRIPNTKIKTSAVISEKKGWYQSSMGINHDGHFIHEFNPRQLKKFGLSDWMDKQLTMDVTVKDPDKKQMTKALLKTAYLYCFSHWGYEFCFSPAGELIRSVLKGEAEYPISVTNSFWDKKNYVDFGSLPIGPVYVHNRTEVFGLFIYVPLQLKSNGYNAIIPVQIPAPTDTGLEDITYLQKKIQSGVTLDVLITPIMDSLETTLCIPYLHSWLVINRDILGGKFSST